MTAPALGPFQIIRDACERGAGHRIPNSYGSREEAIAEIASLDAEVELEHERAQAIIDEVCPGQNILRRFTVTEIATRTKRKSKP